MKVVVSYKNFKKSVGIVERVVGRNSSLPILETILLKVENGRLRVSATNLEIGVNCLIGAKVEEVGEISIPAKILSDLVSIVSDDKITLSTKNNVLSINSGSYKTQIYGFTASEFPIIPKIKGNITHVINSINLKKALSAVIDSVSSSETRPELSGVYINFSPTNITFTATDSFRLTEKAIPVKNTISQSIIIPRNTVAELIKICSEMDGDVKVQLSENQISFSTDEFEMISRLIEGSYPDYKKVIPEKVVSRIAIKKDELEKNVRLAGLFSSTISDIKLSGSEAGIEVYSQNTQKGEMRAKIDGEFKENPFEISLNFRYLLDGIKIIDSEKVVVEFTGNGSPLVIRPFDDKTLLYLIMPLRTGGQS